MRGGGFSAEEDARTREGPGSGEREEAMTFKDLIAQKAEKNGKKVFLLFKEERVTYSEVHERSNSVANALLELGLQKGDKVNIMLPQLPGVHLYLVRPLQGGGRHGSHQYLLQRGRAEIHHQPFGFQGSLHRPSIPWRIRAVAKEPKISRG